MIDPERDGIDHINIYSKGKTELGKMLSNFSKFLIHTKDGDFMSVEGYWYWMSIEPCTEREQLRKCYGFWAKQTGEKILKTKQLAFDDDFEHKILLAIWYKFCRNVHLILPEYQNLPFYHYYNYNGKIIDVTEKYRWMIDGITKMRNKLINTTKRKEINMRKIYCDLCGKEFNTYTRLETHYHDYEPYQEEVTYPKEDECHLIKNYICNDCFDNFEEIIREEMIETGSKYVKGLDDRLNDLKEQYEKNIQALKDECEYVEKLTKALPDADLMSIDEREYGYRSGFPWSKGSYYLEEVERVREMKLEAGEN